MRRDDREGWRVRCWERPEPLPHALRRLRWEALAHVPDRHGWGVAWEEITDALTQVPAARQLSPQGLAALASQRLDRAADQYAHPQDVLDAPIGPRDPPRERPCR